LKETGSSERLVECHAAYARALEQLGNKDLALKQWQAAMSLARPTMPEDTLSLLIG
jgi:hypothetical protein